MIVKVSDLKPNMAVIYKLNYPNNKSYIGYTMDLRRRMWEHNNRRNGKIQKCDEAIDEFGKIEEIEILEFLNNEFEAEEKERYWIKYFNTYENQDIGYNQTPGGWSNLSGELSAKAKLKNNEVLDIRKRRYDGERKKDVYLDYQDKISFGGFEKIWLGQSYPMVGKEYLIPTNSISRQEYSHNANKGINNGRAKCTIEQIKEMRKRYDAGEKIVSIAKDFPFIKVNTVNRIVHRKVYKDII